MRKILLVEDDPSFRVILKSTLKRYGFQVFEAESYDDAMKLLDSDLDVIISDVQMPGKSGIELCKDVKLRLAIPFILMTGFSEVSTTLEAKEVGADALLKKPFEEEDVKTVLEDVLSSRQDVSEFSAVHLDLLTLGASSHCPLYIKINESKFVKIAHRGEELDLDKISKFSETKKLTHLFIRDQDLSHFFGITVQHAAPILSSKKSIRAEKILGRMNEFVQEKIWHSELNQDSFDLVKGLCGVALKTYIEIDRLENLVTFLEKMEQEYAHSFTTAIFSVLIARELDPTVSTQELTHLMMGALFHDIGKKELDPALLKKSQGTMSHLERTLYMSHPKRGAELLDSIPGIPMRVKEIVLKHHECGPSNRKADTDSNLQSQIDVVRFCDSFAKVSMSSLCWNDTPSECLKKMTEFNFGFLNEHMKALSNLIKPKGGQDD